jgi:hypothetical protein
MIQITVKQNNMALTKLKPLSQPSIFDTTQSSLYATQRSQSIAQQLERLANKLRRV